MDKPPHHSHPPCYDADPDALAWARGKVAPVIAKLRDFASAADDVDAQRWTALANLLDIELNGHGPCFGAFDKRLPDANRDAENVQLHATAS